jgi:hypothetical protein
MLMSKIYYNIVFGIASSCSNSIIPEANNFLEIIG